MEILTDCNGLCVGLKAWALIKSLLGRTAHVPVHNSRLVMGSQASFSAELSVQYHQSSWLIGYPCI